MRWKVGLFSTAWLAVLVVVPAFAQVQTAVDLPATGQWVDTGIDVQKGDSLAVTINARRARARAKPQAISSPGPGTPGSEVLQSAPPPPPTLTGRIAEVTFAVSVKCIAPATGRLFLRTNDSAAVSSVTAGTARVRITHVARAAPEPSVGAKAVLPNVVGMRFGAAARSLKKYGLAARRQNVPSSRPAGEVLEQSPAPGVDTETVKVVVLVVSGGTLAATNVAPPKPQTAQTAAAPVRMPGRGVLLPPRTRITPAGYATPHSRPTATPAAPPASVTQTSAAPVSTATSVRPATPQPSMTAAPGTTAPSLATVAPSPPATRPPAPPSVSVVVVSVPSVVGLTQQDAASTVARSKLRAVNRGAEPSSIQQGRVTRTDPPAGARLTPGALVGYWLASGENVVPNLQDRTTNDASALLKESGFRLGTIVSHGGGEPRVAEQDPAAGTPARLNSAVNVTVGTPSNGWVVWLVVAGLAVIAALGGLAINGKMRLARTTAHALTIQPSLDPDGPVSFEGEVTMAGPAAHLRASLEDGEASFEEPGAVIERKEQDV